ncbi:MAG: helix-turn-helix transcriptional regulator [Clostridiales bacterium]|nr:helix-turn-helix transcriptional regulator [Clostridiales bacterium]
MKPLNEFIRDLRIDRDKTQSQVAEELHIKQQYYSKYENGEYELPIRHLVGLANYYNTNTDYILQRTKFKHSLDRLSMPYLEDISIDQLLGMLLSLEKEDRKSAIEYINFLVNKQKNSQQ